MQRYRLPRPKWFPGPETQREPLTLPVSTGTYAALALMLAAVPAFELIMRVSLGARAAAPLGVLANGVVQGCLTGLVAVGLILVYRTTRIINFAQASLGSVAAIVVTLLVQNYNLPFIVVVPLGLGFAVAAGALAELLLRRFSKAPRLVVTIATIALAPLVQQLMNFLVQTLNPLPVGLERAQASLRKIPVPFSGLKFTIAPLTFGFAEVATVMGSITVMALLALFLRRTRVGSAVRGAAENSEAAWLLGINIRLLSTMVWALAAVLSGLGALFALMINGVDTSASDAGAAMMLPAIVAAMVAGMETMPVAMLFAIWFAVLEQAIHWAFPDAHFHEVGLLVATLVSLLLQRRRLQRRESKQGSAWEAAKDIRATPVQLRTVPLVRNGRYLLIGLGLLGVVIFPLVTVAGQLHAGGLVLITVMIVLSLMVLTGWAGQVSLGQFALVAVGGVFGAGLTSRYGLSFWLVLPLVSLLGAAVAVLLGLPSLRLRGLYLAAVTLAFALAVPVVLFSPQFFGFIQVEGIIDRPRLFFIDFTDERSFYYLLLICTVGWIYLTVWLRRSRAGRLLIALRDNEQAAQSVGISALQTRLGAFALSGFIAAFAGVLLVHFEQSASVKQFGVDQSLSVFLYLVIGGMGSVSGAVTGAVAGAGVLYLLPGLAELVTGSTAFIIMMARPDGLAGVLYAVRDSVLRVIALRLRISVPSLFADYDAEAQKREELPLGQPIAGLGLATLPVTQRYGRKSFLWTRGRS